LVSPCPFLEGADPAIGVERLLIETKNQAEVANRLAGIDDPRLELQEVVLDGLAKRQVIQSFHQRDGAAPVSRGEVLHLQVGPDFAAHPQRALDPERPETFPEFDRLVQEE
jgi:hypothetical protein